MGAGQPQTSRHPEGSSLDQREALSKIRVAQRSGGCSSGVCPFLRLTMNEAPSFTHVRKTLLGQA